MVKKMVKKIGVILVFSFLCIYGYSQEAINKDNYRIEYITNMLTNLADQTARLNNIMPKALLGDTVAKKQSVELLASIQVSADLLQKLDADIDNKTRKELFDSYFSKMDSTSIEILKLEKPILDGDFTKRKEMGDLLFNLSKSEKVLNSLDLTTEEEDQLTERVYNRIQAAITEYDMLRLERIAMPLSEKSGIDATTLTQKTNYGCDKVLDEYEKCVTKLIPYMKEKPKDAEYDKLVEQTSMVANELMGCYNSFSDEQLKRLIDIGDKVDSIVGKQ